MLDHVNKGRLTLERFVQLVAARPAARVRHRPKRPFAGYDAEFTIVDMKHCETITNAWMITGVEAYDGKTVQGWPVAPSCAASGEREWPRASQGEPCSSARRCC